MHDGRFKTLAQVLAFYNTLDGQIRIDHHQETVLKPLLLPPEDLLALEAFLNSLQDGLLQPGSR
jgi:cytochrome c peroxidase